VTVNGLVRQTQVYLAGVSGRRPRVPMDPGRLEDRASRAMPGRSWAYIRAGAGAERTMAANREAFDRVRIVPRMLRDVSTRDTSVELFGRRFEAPVLTAPIGVLELAHREADIAVARGAREARVPMVISNQASRPMEDIARELGDTPRWFQLYWSKSDALVESFVRRAEACGAEAIVVTLDTTMLGWRPRDLEIAFLPFLRGKGIAQYTSDPVFRTLVRETSTGDAPTPRPTLQAIRTLIDLTRAYPDRFLPALRSGDARAAVQRFVELYSRPSLTWENLPFLRKHTSLPIVLKGVLHPDDAARAVDEGIDGIVVSNHGGRQVDGSIATLDALPAIANAVDGRIPIMLDSGIRTGADVFKALALGATAVHVGRPFVYGLAIAGAEGVREVLENVVAEFDLTMGLAGCTNPSEIRPETVEREFSPGGSGTLHSWQPQPNAPQSGVRKNSKR
jgi:lactate 2-monooxygenase